MMHDRLSASGATILAVVVTFDRRELLVECLQALADQTHPVDRVLVVDNASTDGSEGFARERLPPGLRVDWLRLSRNGGGAEGFHYGVARALRADSQADWLWLMDDDCAPEPTCLADLLGSPPAADPDAVALAPLVVTPSGEAMPLNRGWLAPRWFRSPLVGLSPRHVRGPEAVELDFASLVGPLVRTAAARRTEPPRRDFFIWFDDLEWFLRLREHGRLWLVPRARVVHRDPRQLSGLSTRELLREFGHGYPFAQRWKRLYGMRNMIWCGRRHGFMTLPRAVAFASASALRGLLFESHRRRTLALAIAYATDGWRGRFRNLAPAEWAELAGDRRPLRRLSRAALRYDQPVAAEPHALCAPSRTPR